MNPINKLLTQPVINFISNIKDNSVSPVTVFYGNGSNGKTTLINVLREVLNTQHISPFGPYNIQKDIQLIIVKEISSKHIDKIIDLALTTNIPILIESTTPIVNKHVESIKFEEVFKSHPNLYLPTAETIEIIGSIVNKKN